MSGKPLGDSLQKLAEQLLSFQTESYGWLLAHRGMIIIITKAMTENDPEFASKHLLPLTRF
jgi:hypothetical protein